MAILVTDIETRSAVDIASCGAYRYIQDESFEILLIAYAFDDEPVRVIDLTQGEPVDERFLCALYDPGVTKVAHNYFFERWAFEKHFHRYCPPEEWEDTMILAANCGLPLALGQCCEALRLPKDEAKDKDGRALIRKFCVPKKNGGFTAPSDAPEAWSRFVSYCGQDVIAERTVFRMLEQWLPTGRERDIRCLDARINEAGVRVDRILAAHAAEMGERFRAELTEKAVALTGLDNPGSVTQIKRWLKEQEGLDVVSLNKKAVADVVAQLETDEAKEFMRLRSMLAQTSITKYDTMLRCTTDDDPHTRGTMQFFGAHTGRWAGRLLQTQNLKRNDMPDLAEARELVRAGDYETLKCLYDNVPGVLSELIRTGIVPEPGCRLVVADFSAIEARVTAWLAGEEWRMEVFRNGGDIYCASASQMFHVPVVKHGENGDLRQKGKVAELACIAEGQPVLTKRGLIPIQKVRLDDLVWDGAEWAAHDGVVCRGEKEVIRYGDLTATPDHLVFIEGADQPVRFELAAASGARLLRGDDRRTAVWEDSDYLFGEAMVRRTSRVYDIINCGPRHRFTVSGVLVHNCGYGGGIGALKAFGGDKPWRDSKGVEHPGMTEEEMGEIVGRWRESSPKIVAMWKKLERAAILCASRHTTAETGLHGVRFEWERGIMWMVLPSGRRMAYFNAEYRDFPRRVGTGKCLTYMVLNQTTRKWERVETFGGRTAENCIQAIARDCLREAMLNLEHDGWDMRFTVHDEIVCSEPVDSGRGWECMATQMAMPIDWAPGLLLRADGYECEFYQKD